MYISSFFLNFQFSLFFSPPFLFSYSFQNVVKTSRGDRLKANDAELFSGRAWTGHQAVKLGLLDGIGTMRGTMREKFGDKTRFLLCSEAPQPSIRDYLGFGSFASGGGSSTAGLGLARHAEQEAGGRGSEGLESGLKALLEGEAGYGAARAAVRAALDEAEERTLWDKWRFQ